jgi:hypothetical protein
MECEAAQSHCTQSAGVVSRVRSAEVRFRPWAAKRGMHADVQSEPSRVVCGCEMIEIMERSGGEI